jgi:nucleoside-diphosphate-sugar epimerase
LVLGGTGPTGPYVVNGLLKRGHDVTVMHGGLHEVDYDGPVEHLHGDVHFRETLGSALGTRRFDLVVAMYGRLRETAEFMIGRTERLVAVGAAGAMAGPRDARWGPLGRPVMVPEDGRITPDPRSSGLAFRIHAAKERVMELHAAGHYQATLIGYSILYGERQIAPEDWCVVRRILDGRRRLVIPDGGLKIQQRTYVEHAAQAVLLAIDQPAAAAGRFFAVGELPLFTMRQRIEWIARIMDVELEFVNLPWDLAKPSHYLFGHTPDHVVHDDSAIRSLLGYRETIPAAEALVRTVRWLLDNRSVHAAEWEQQIDDTFDYAAEDALDDRWTAARRELATIEVGTRAPAHRYRHPKYPDEPWTRPEVASDRRPREHGAKDPAARNTGGR